MSNHLGDTNKMVDTPRTYLQDRLLSMVHAFHDDQRKYAVRLLANDVADLEHKLNAANDRIKQLEYWKESALEIEREWDANAIATMLGGKLGESQRKVIQREVPLLLERIKRLEDAGDEMFLRSTRVGREIWRKAKEAKL